MLTVPNMLNNEFFLGAPLDYKWGNKAAGFYAVDAEKMKLGVALFTINHKATFGIATALMEWVYWRVSRHIEIPTFLPIIESQWAAIIDKHYSFHKDFENTSLIDEDFNPAVQPIWVMLFVLNSPKYSYFNGRFLINVAVDKLAVLARHISPDKKFFDSWLSHVLKKAAKLFPAQYSYHEVIENRKEYFNKSYDSSDESAIPREFFFEPDYDYNVANNHLLINKFLSSLDYKNNPNLNSPEQMIAEGFAGTPYQYEGE